MGEAERGDAAPRFVVSYWCANGHETRPAFAEESGRLGPGHLGLPALRLPRRPGRAEPPAPPKVEPYKTHLAYVKERRSDTDGKAILDEALEQAPRSRPHPLTHPHHR
nr:RNA polymerase-binding protein RbpA [Angustibacter aerolatus]